MDLQDLLPDARGLRRAATLAREGGEHELAMRLDDAARYVGRLERIDRAVVLRVDREAFGTGVTP